MPTMPSSSWCVEFMWPWVKKSPLAFWSTAGGGGEVRLAFVFNVWVKIIDKKEAWNLASIKVKDFGYSKQNELGTLLLFIKNITVFF